MGTSDGTILGTTKIVDNGPAAERWNLVILGDGYQASEMDTYISDVDNFIQRFRITPPFDEVWSATNIYRVDVTSTDSGADDPAACGGTGATPNTYFDASFCTNNIRRLLVVNTSTALSVATSQVPEMHQTIVIVNSSIYGGSGGAIAVFSTASSAPEIAIHELGHSAFGLADEYSYYAGCGSGETGHDNYSGPEPFQPNVTKETDRNTIKWRDLILATTPLPTTSNSDCTQCDTQPNPFPPDTVGAFEGARYFHCDLFRPQFNCKMRNLGQSFCAVCQQVIREVFQPYMPSLELKAGRTSNSVTDSWTQVTFASSFTSKPVVLASIETFNGADAAGLRMKGVSNNGFSVKIEEEQSRDQETYHVPEVVGYVGIYEGNLRDHLGVLVGEAGMVTVDQNDGSQWHTVMLQNSYSNPVALMHLLTFNGIQPAHTRIRNVGSSSFEYQIEEWDYLDQYHVAETIGYLVVESGRYQMADGTMVEAGKVNTDHNWAAVTFGSTFASTPVTISHCQTYNGYQAVVTRGKNLSVSGFEVRLQEEEGNDGIHLVETIGYIAILQ